jgi:hypothetical protein
VINDFIGKAAVAVAKAKTKEDAEKLAKMKDAPKQVMECVEQAVQNQIDMITQLHDTIDEGKKVLQSAEDHIKNAEKRVKTNTTSDWAGVAVSSCVDFATEPIINLA